MKETLAAIFMNNQHFLLANKHLFQVGLSWLMFNFIYLLAYVRSDNKEKAKKTWLRVNLGLLVIVLLSGLIMILVSMVPNLINISLEVDDVGHLSSEFAQPVQTWHENTLVITKDYIISPCDPGKMLPVVVGTYQVKKDKIAIGYRSFLQDSACACMCVKRITYRISNLEHQDYQITNQPLI